MRERGPSGDPAAVGFVQAGFADALAAWPGAVTLVTLADGRDDIGSTVSAFCPVSADPPLVLVSLLGSSYPAEVLGRLESFAVTLLTVSQRALAGRFAAAGRPGARVLLENVPHQRGPASGALIPAGGLAALECEVTERIPAGDHVLVVAQVVNVPYISEYGDPLIRFRGAYLTGR
jgi:flavin reductase (DIM6/NTAB) family NADH-FMN oxidoreductase RutF